VIYLYDKIWLQCTRDLIHTLKGKLYKLFNSSVLLENQEKRDTKVENLYITNKSTLIYSVTNWYSKSVWPEW